MNVQSMKFTQPSVQLSYKLIQGMFPEGLEALSRRTEHRTARTGCWPTTGHTRHMRFQRCQFMELRMLEPLEWGIWDGCWTHNPVRARVQCCQLHHRVAKVGLIKVKISSEGCYVMHFRA